MYIQTCTSNTVTVMVLFSEIKGFKVAFVMFRNHNEILDNSWENLVHFCFIMS